MNVIFQYPVIHSRPCHYWNCPFYFNYCEGNGQNLGLATRVTPWWAAQKTPAPGGTAGVSSTPAAALQQHTSTQEHGVPTLDWQALKSWCHQPWDSLLESPRPAHLPGHTMSAWTRTSRLLAAYPAAADPGFKMLLSLGKFAKRSHQQLPLTWLNTNWTLIVYIGGSRWVWPLVAQEKQSSVLRSLDWWQETQKESEWNSILGQTSRNEAKQHTNQMPWSAQESLQHLKTRESLQMIGGFNSEMRNYREWRVHW